MKTKLEYAIINKDNSLTFDVLPTREDARIEKAYYKAEGLDVKIVQRKYELKGEKIVR